MFNTNEKNRIKKNWSAVFFKFCVFGYFHFLIMFYLLCFSIFVERSFWFFSFVIYFVISYSFQLSLIHVVVFSCVTIFVQHLPVVRNSTVITTWNTAVDPRNLWGILFAAVVVDRIAVDHVGRKNAALSWSAMTERDTRKK